MRNSWLTRMIDRRRPHISRRRQPVWRLPTRHVAGLALLVMAGALLATTIRPEIAMAQDVRWPRGTRIAYDSSRDGNAEIYTMFTDGGDQIRLTDNPAFDGEPAWSPDRSSIAFVSDRDGTNNIYVMNADGTNAHPLTSNQADNIDPAWSPDGQRIAFASNQTGNYDIYSMLA